jgi:hypothetical protein
MIQAPYTTKKYSFLKKLYTWTLVVLVTASTIPFSTTQAAGPVVEVGPSAAFTFKTSIESTISAIADDATAFFTSSLELKDLQYDAIAWQLVNVALEQMIKSTTQWVNSGFNGSPVFVTDLEGYLTDVGDQVAGEFIWGAQNEQGNYPLRFLCSPFALDIKMALNIQYATARSKSNLTSQCKLSGIVKNVDNFLDGDFLDGGWEGWFDIALTPNNNPYGAMLEAQSVMQASIQGSQDIERQYLGYGDGFFTLRKNGKVTTPGALIQDQMSSVLSIPQGRLTVADEINELVGALMQQLANEINTEGGLRGLTDSGYGNGNYFDRMQNVRDTSGQINISAGAYEEALALETKYKGLQEQVVNLINAAEQTCRAVPGGGPLTSSLQNKRTKAQTEVAASTALITKLEGFINDSKILTQAKTTDTPEVRAILTRYTVTTVPAAQARLAEEFSTYRRGGQLHTATQVAQVESRTLADPGSERTLWSTIPDNLRAEILLFTTDDPETGRIDDRCRSTEAVGTNTFGLPDIL